jgi:hypothetical protein
VSAAKFEMPLWVPGPIGSLAQTLCAEAVLRPLEPFPAHAEALRRVATDERMQEAWNEIYRRWGTDRRARPYVHPARRDMVRACPQFSGVEHISRQADEQDRVQDQAAAVLFLVVTGNALWDRRDSVGPRTRTEAEVNEEIAELRELADSNETAASKYARLGDGRAAQTL